MCSHIRAGTGNCIGINDIKILCQRLPSLASVLASFQANIVVGNEVRSLGISVSFPHGRCPRIRCPHIEVSIAMLQKMWGAGVGFPASNTTFSVSMLQCVCGGKLDMFAGTAGSNPGTKDMPLSLCTL